MKKQNTEVIEDERTLYIVCNSSVEVAPNNILRIYKSKEAAYRFLGKYVAELNKSTYTGYLSIAEKRIGNNDEIKVLGVEGD